MSTFLQINGEKFQNSLIKSNPGDFQWIYLVPLPYWQRMGEWGSPGWILHDMKKKKERPNIHSKATKKKVDNILFTIRLHHTTTPFYATYTPRTSTLLRRQIRTRIVNNNKPQFLWFIRMTTFITYRDYTRIYLSTKGCLGLRNYGWKIGSNLTLGFSNRAHYVFAVI